MPRIRSLKPEHKQHRKVGRLSHFAYRLWVGMITEADDEGRLVAEPDQLRAVIFPYAADLSLEAVAEGVENLAAVGLIRVYAWRHVQYAHFPDWKQHQKIDRPMPSKLPVPPYLRSTRTRRTLDERSTNARGGSEGIKDRIKDQGSEGRGREGSVRGGKPEPVSLSPIHRTADNLDPTVAIIADVTNGVITQDEGRARLRALGKAK